MARRRLLTIGHSYTVSLNRRLAYQMAAVGKDEWEVTVVAPTLFRGVRDLREAQGRAEANEPVGVEFVPARWTSRVHFFHYNGRLRRIMQRGWDAVHCWEEPFILAGGQIARLCDHQKVPFVFYTFQNYAKKYPPPFAQIERYCVDRCAGWLAAGETTMQAQLKRGYDRKPHAVAPLGVDMKHFRPDSQQRSAIRRSLGWKDDGAPVIGFLGRFLPEKGLPLLMQALDGIQSDWRALFIGAGIMEAELRNWGGRYGERVKICNSVEHEQVPAYLNAVDILAAPSQTTPQWREQFGRMLIEGFACGLCVVGSDSGEIPYVVGDAGTILPETDTTAWREALAMMIDSPRMREEFATRGLERARTDFDWPVVARKYLDFIASVC